MPTRRYLTYLSLKCFAGFSILVGLRLACRRAANPAPSAPVHRRQRQWQRRRRRRRHQTQTDQRHEAQKGAYQGGEQCKEKRMRYTSVESAVAILPEREVGARDVAPLNQRCIRLLFLRNVIAIPQHRCPVGIQVSRQQTPSGVTSREMLGLLTSRRIIQGATTRSEREFRGRFHTKPRRGLFESPIGAYFSIFFLRWLFFVLDQV
jgi:hypothetical protein